MIRPVKIFRKYIISFLIVILALWMALGMNIQTVGAAQGEIISYVKDVKLYYVDTDVVSKDVSAETIAQRKADKDGYTIVPKELNSGTGEKFVFLGYKGTNNRDEAIVDLRLLGMNRDYQLYNYSELLEYMKNSNKGTAQTMLNAADQFIINYRDGSPKAKDAYEGLNLFYVDEETKTKLGDYILADKADLDFFARFVTLANTGTINAVLNYLNLGIAPYDPDASDSTEVQTEAVTEAKTETDAQASPDENAPASSVENTEGSTEETVAVASGPNWAKSLSGNELWETVDDKLTTAQQKELDRKYNDDAKLLFKQIQDFTTNYENAQVRFDKNEEELVEKNEEINSDQDKLDAVENSSAEDADCLYLGAYEIMNAYKVKGDQKLGDWMLEIGNQTSDQVDMNQLYPLVDSMGTAQAGMTGLIGLVPTVSNLGENQHNEEFEETLPKIKGAINEYNGGDSISLWHTEDDDLENGYIAYTSDAVRKGTADHIIGTKTQLDKDYEKIMNVLQWINLGLGVLTVATYTISLAFTITGSLTGIATASAACASVSAFCGAAVGVLSVISSLTMWIGIGVLVFTLAVMFIYYVGPLIWEEYPVRYYHTNMPSYVFDAAETNDGDEMTIKYKCVMDENNDIGDLNARAQKSWLLMCYSRDQRIGSPITIKEGAWGFFGNDNPFAVYYGDPNVKNGYDCVNFFGERGPGDCNTYCKKNNAHGIYVHYRTEKSYGEGDPVEPEPDSKSDESTGNETSYIGDIIITTAQTESDAKAKIKRKDGFYVLDRDLSPDIKDQWTYIGYSITTDPDKAITDIRVAPYNGSGDVTFGEITYRSCGLLGFATDGSDNSITYQTDSLMKTSDPDAGSPIPVDNLHIVNNPGDAEDGWEPVSLFCGLPYNFDTVYDDCDGTMLSGYSIDDSNNWDQKESVYVFYEPSESYSGGMIYLSGIFFLGGYKRDKTFGMLWTETEASVEQLINDVKKYDRVTVYDSKNLCFKYDDRFDMGSGHDWKRLYMGTVWTYNPKRALTDVVVYQGDSYSDTLPYSISKISNETNSSISYTACSTIEQQAVKYGGVQHFYVSRFIHPGNCFIDSKALLVSEEDYSEKILKGYTYSLPENFEFGYKKSNLLPAGLYVSGYVEGKDPLMLSDLKISDSDVVTSSSYWGTSYRPVTEIKDPNSTKSFKISYPTWYDNNDNSHETDGKVFLFLDSKKESKGKYISAVSLGSYSRSQYKADATMGSSGSGVDEANADPIINSTAMLSAASSCSDEIIPFNIGVSNQGYAWYNWNYDGKASTTAPENPKAAYLGLSRTDDRTEAITGIVLYQNDSDVTAKEITVDGARYYCDNISSPMQLGGKRYFLYYTRNPGVMSGNPIEDIAISTEYIKQGYSTAFCAKPGMDKPYGDSTLGNYIHLKYNDGVRGTYYSELAIGIGDNRNEAMADLISQSCDRYIPLDLNVDVPGAGIYLGYSNIFIDTATATEDEKEDALYESIYDILVTEGEPYHPEGFVDEKTNIYYKPVSDVDLNSYMNGESSGYELYMYYCSPFTAYQYNRIQKKAKTGIVTTSPDEVFSAPITNIAMARYDRVPYNESIESSDKAVDPNLRWEYVMVKDKDKPVNLNAGVSVNGFSRTDNRISMFVQREDGSVKPSGEIIGGYMTDITDIGTIDLVNS